MPLKNESKWIWSKYYNNLFKPDNIGSKLSFNENKLETYQMNFLNANPDFEQKPRPVSGVDLSRIRTKEHIYSS